MGWKCNVCNLSNTESLPDDIEESTLNASASDLSTSVGALVDEQAKFPINEIRIEKIESLDAASPKASSPAGLRKRVVKGKGGMQTESNEPETPEPANVNDNNNNNNVNNEEAAPRRAAAAPQEPPVSLKENLLDILIAAVFFSLLLVVLNKFLLK